ncbi:MAG: hypothetical protein SVU94_04600 [Bacteroidota bacterium]|nr:hypothetical protein [Bacteroidota bacterium]
MPNSGIKKFYKERINDFQKKESSIKQKILWLGLLRFVSFLLFIVGIVFTIKDFSCIRLILTLTWLVLFIGFVVLHLAQNQKLKLVQSFIQINKQELKALNYDFAEFNDGEEFIHRDHPYAYDLDLFGKGSLFQCLNRTFTQAGRIFLADRLLNPLFNKQKIEYTQQAIQELSEKIDWRQHLQATGKLVNISPDDNQKIKLWVKAPANFINKWYYKLIVWGLPLLTISSLFLLIFGWLHYSVFVFLALCQLFFASLIMRRTNKEQRIISEEIGILKNYHQLIQIIENSLFHSFELNQLKKEFYVNNKQTASIILKKLIRIIDAFDSRLNIIVGLILNATLMWDLLSLMRLEKWKKQYGGNISLWIKSIAQLDAFCSMANFRFNYPDYIFPQVVNQLVIDAKEVGHPLIFPNKRVNNDFRIDKPGQINIITGANMAGKSTFLRTIGVNLILAMNGMPVCAKQFDFRLMHLYSGMRTSDSLKENESYFYAELRRLKQIIDELKSGKELFILLDEILKGTNSVDKAKGAWKFVEHLIKLNATGVIATHDLTLCELENQYSARIKNQCFEVEISRQKIFFDYKLRNGITKNMNASVLMKQMGIFPC